MNTSETPWPGISIPTAVPERSVRVLAAAKAVVASQPRLFKEPGVEGGALLTWEDLGRTWKDRCRHVEALESCGADFVERRYLEDWTKSYQVIPSPFRQMGVPWGSNFRSKMTTAMKVFLMQPDVFLRVYTNIFYSLMIVKMVENRSGRSTRMDVVWFLDSLWLLCPAWMRCDCRVPNCLIQIYSDCAGINEEPEIKQHILYWISFASPWKIKANESLW